MALDWQIVETEGEAEGLLDVFGGFHDSCLREVHIWTETWVGDDLRMACPGHLDTHCRMLFQRQFLHPSAIEMLFDEVVAFHLSPAPENYDAVIFEATLLIRDGFVYWADTGAWHPDHRARDGSTWIAAKRLRWREASAWMGDRLRYGPAAP